MLFKILFPFVFTAGFYFLIKSIGRILQIYGDKKTEFPATASKFTYHAQKAGDFEIAYKRSAVFGVIPSNIPFRLISKSGQEEVQVRRFVNHLGSWKDLSGNRIVPIAAFTLNKPGEYDLYIPEISGQKENDKLQIGVKTGSEGFLMIFAIILSAIATIAGLVLTILAFMNKL